MSNTTFSLWIINKAGGLIYQKTYAEGLLPQLTSNDYLVLAGTFHGIHAITSKLSPVYPSGGGVESVDAETFKMSCFQTLTGTKFVVFTSPSHPSPSRLLSRIYTVYADLLKDPFYTIENPIRNESFDRRCQAICATTP
ncbi:hypothetical protein PCANC_04490 [Puccinia coronata f. sp. avenae]|uniref:Trafficking protein particle complex subunit n=1 Tax=Puccinia coronata f. sp. avenae TaxID=200324 RepID=A0A2N5UP57_9BASI|nr:hypothetical protein PCASD_18220 [Puccinia coronata f. sp. avenae]PLW19472.1 hypothetical protein PCANC_08770 [Puccinia coronata f. sp. avenae]PLW39545.1 hypothetical protein PCASD_07688 [Puccinia coronata f. sp. avenae]PLW53752.1 hypothetical protein PCANC_04490 [Puccinia coronata f. sp. avenae]